MSQRVTIRYHRYNRPPVNYSEGFIEDNGSRLRTRTEVPADIAARLAAGWIADGLLPADSVIAAVCKHQFYGEYFAIMELRDAQDAVLGYYCDIATPLEKLGDGEYSMQDLILDLWVFPDQQVRQLDWQEFEVAELRGMIPAPLAKIARRTLTRLVEESKEGKFPREYIR